MALTESLEYDQLTVVGDCKHIQVRKATVIKKDGVVISRSYERYSLDCGKLKGGVKDDGVTPADDAQDLVDNPLDKEPDGVTAIPDEIKSICNLLWTDSVKAAWRTKLIAEDSE